MEAVLFDIDGTLVDSNEQHVNAWAFAFRDEGKPQELDDIRAQIGKGGDLLVPALLPDLDGIAQKRIADLHGAYFKDIYLDAIRPFDNATALIERVHTGGRKLVLASSAKKEELDHYVDLLGIGDLLAATTSIDDVEASKPEPDIFEAPSRHPPRGFAASFDRRADHPIQRVLGALSQRRILRKQIRPEPLRQFSDQKLNTVERGIVHGISHAHGHANSARSLAASSDMCRSAARPSSAVPKHNRPPNCCLSATGSISLYRTVVPELGRLRETWLIS